ncbi:MAG: carboxypeptidase-like regulatory domain-containing protein [Breznakibacter sp.]
MKQLTIIFFVIFSIAASYSQDSVRIYGHVTDFGNRPLDSVSVRLKNKKFENLYETITDKNGFYSLTVLKGSYYCLYVIKLPDYGKTKLEYWAWNIPAYNDLEINPQYERMEIYGINAFEPQAGPWDTYMIYFRPMSLTKSLALEGNKGKKEVEKKAIANRDTIDIAPSIITKEELEISINGRKSEIVNITKTPEYARGAYLYGYMVQVKKPEETSQDQGKYDKVTVVLRSKETKEYGKGEYFIEKIK